MTNRTNIPHEDCFLEAGMGALHMLHVLLERSISLPRGAEGFSVLYCNPTDEVVMKIKELRRELGQMITRAERVKR